jgi:hypothetical protein
MQWRISPKQHAVENYGTHKTRSSWRDNPSKIIDTFYLKNYEQGVQKLM